MDRETVIGKESLERVVVRLQSMARVASLTLGGWVGS
jgi:hypothetical protein